MRTMTKERKKEGPRLGHKGRADAKASRQLLLLCIPAIIGYILFNYIPMGAAVIIPFKNYKFSKGILGSDWCGLANFKWIIQSVALDRALRNTVLYGLLFMVLSPVTNVIIALLLFEITSRRRLKTYQTIITFPNFMSMVIVGYIVYAILSPRTGLMNQIIQFFGGDPVDVYMNPKYWPFILTVVNLWKGIGMGSMMYFAALMGIDTSLYEAAEIDGASRFQKMLHISLPHLVPLICIFTIMNAGSLISGNFDLFYVIPRNTSTLYATTDILNTYVYRSLQESSYAIGATTGLIQSVVGMGSFVRLRSFLCQQPLQEHFIIRIRPCVMAAVSKNRQPCIAARTLYCLDHIDRLRQGYDIVQRTMKRPDRHSQYLCVPRHSAAAARRDSREQLRRRHRKEPCAVSAHAESCQRDPIRVAGVCFDHAANEPLQFRKHRHPKGPFRAARFDQHAVFFPRFCQDVRQSMNLSLLQILTTAAFTCAVQLDNHWKTCVHPLRHPDGIGKARICQPMILYVHFVSSALSQMTFADAISCQKMARAAFPSAVSSQQQSRTGSSSSSIRSSRPSA